LRLDRSPLLQNGNDVIIFPWRGDIVLNTLEVLLRSQRIDVARDGVALECSNCSVERLLHVMRKIVSGPMPDARDLAWDVKNKTKDKYDGFLGVELLNAAYAARDLDVVAMWQAPVEMIAHGSRDDDFDPDPSVGEG
jgi:ATP-dependent Lhr-like helicase